MKRSFRLSFLLLPVAAHLFVAGQPLLASQNAGEDIIVLDAVAVQNLGIETVEAVPRALEQTAFALGVIEARPQGQAVVASRIPGRIVALEAFPGDRVEKGAVVAKVESRLLGSPPQVVDLIAPISGTLTQLDVRLGDPVEPDRPLLQITDLSGLLAVARVPEHLAARISAGSVAHIRIPALGSGLLEGKLLRFGTLADAASGTVDAYFTLPDGGTNIVPGMRAEFSIVLGERAEVVSVPRSAVQGQGGARFVFVSHFDLPNAFVKSPVVLGEGNDRYVEIVSGLFPGDEVVTKGAYSLSFAGGGSLSLKEALDAAHGHAHNEDGSEISDSGAGGNSSDDGHAHGEGDHAGGSRIWQIVSGVLFLALLASLWGRKRVVTEEPATGGEADGERTPRQTKAAEGDAPATHTVKEDK